MKAIEDTARAVISGWVSAWLDQRGAWLDDRQHRKWLDEFDPTDRSDRDLFLARVADRYVQTIGDREQISKISGEFVVAPGTVKELIKEARSSDVLSKTTQGRAGGHLTAKAIQLLAGKSAVEIVVEKFGWTEGDAREIVDLIDQAGELDHRLAYFASLPAQDLEERAAAHSRAVEDEKRFVALRAARDSGDITREEYLQRFNQMVAPYMVGI